MHFWNIVFTNTNLCWILWYSMFCPPVISNSNWNNFTLCGTSTEFSIDVPSDSGFLENLLATRKYICICVCKKYIFYSYSSSLKSLLCINCPYCWDGGKKTNIFVTIGAIFENGRHFEFLSWLTCLSEISM